MKVKLLVNLKTEDSTVITPGLYDNEKTPFPSYIENNLKNPKIIKILDAPVAIAPKEESKEKEVPKAKEAEKPKLLKKAK